MNTILDRGDFVFKPPELGCVLSLSELPGGSGKVYDRSPYGNIGSITGASWVRLPSGLWCLSFDGNDDYINCGGSTSLRFTGSFTAIVWGKWKTDVTSTTLVSSHQGAVSGYGLYCDSGDTFKSVIEGLSPISATILESPSLDTWYQAAFVYNMSEGKVYPYLNGAMVGSGVSVTGTPTIATNNLFLGRYGAGAGEFMSGLIALPKIYNRALTALEIQNHFNREKHLFGRW